MKNDNVRELVLSRQLNASKEKVFEALTYPEMLKEWWGPKGVTIPVCEFDARPGGSINIVMLAGDELGEMKGSRWPMTGVVKEIIEPEKLVFESSPIMNNKPIMDALTTITLENNGVGTKMTVKIEITRMTPEAEGPLSGMEMGWNQQLDKLAQMMSN